MGLIDIGLYGNPGDFFTKNKAWFENSMGGGAAVAYISPIRSLQPRSDLNLI